MQRRPLLSTLGILLPLAACAQDINISQDDSGTSPPDLGLPADGGVPDASTADLGPADQGVGPPPVCNYASKASSFELGPSSNESLTSGIVVGPHSVAIVWEDIAQADVWMAMLNHDGSQIRPPRRIGDRSWSPSITAADGDFAVVFHDTAINDIRFQRYDRNGSKSREVQLGVQVGRQSGYPKIAFHKDRFGVSYYSNGSGAQSDKVYFARLDFDGHKIERFYVLPDTQQITALVDITSTNDGWALAWMDTRDGGNRIRSARVGHFDGLKIDPPGDIMVTDGNRDSLFPTIASIGEELHICYDITNPFQQSRQIECTHVNAANQVGRPLRLVDGDKTASLPKTYQNGNNFLSIWSAETSGVGEIFARWFSKDGQPIGNNIRLTEIPATSAYPALDFLPDGSIFVGWYQFSSNKGWTYNYQIFPCQ